MTVMADGGMIIILAVERRNRGKRSDDDDPMRRYNHEFPPGESRQEPYEPKGTLQNAELEGVLRIILNELTVMADNGGMINIFSRRREINRNDDDHC